MSESSLAQRRKKDRDSKKQSTSSTNSSTSREIIANEINKAVQSVHRAKINTLELQKQWREHLLRMSCLVVIIAMHQSSTPVMECIKELKYAKNHNNSVDGSLGAGIIFSDSAVEIMNLIISIALFRFVSLRNPCGTFSNASYCFSSSMILCCLGSFFYKQQQQSIEGSSNNGCLGDLASWTGDEKYLSMVDSATEELGERSKHQFPASCIFHVVVTGCIFFMKMNIDQCDENIAQMEKLQKELEESEVDEFKTSKNKHNKKKATKKKE